MKDIKDYRNNELKNYVIGNILIILFLNGVLDMFFVEGISENVEFLDKIIQSAMVSSITYIYVFLMDSLISADFKEKITYFGIDKMPGYTVFSDMKNGVKDIRFTKETVLEKYREIYEKMPKEKEIKEFYENEQWYQIYKKYRDKNKVFTSHRDYLLCRDITTITLVLMFIYMLLVVIFNTISFSWQTICFLGIEFLVADIAMRVKAKRFVYNVISEDM